MTINDEKPDSGGSQGNDEADAEGRQKRASHKKHPCPDCTCCQWCAEDRCRLCLKRKTCRRKLSLAEQIALYDALNRAPEKTD